MFLEYKFVTIVYVTARHASRHPGTPVLNAGSGMTDE